MSNQISKTIVYTQAPPLASIQELRQLADAFRAGCSAAPPLRHALVAGAACGAGFTDEEWTALLLRHGAPWGKECHWDDPESTEDKPSVLRLIWVCDTPTDALLAAKRRFEELASVAAELTCRGPGHVSPGLPEQWLVDLHALATKANKPMLKAYRYRFVHDLDKLDGWTLRVDYERHPWAIDSPPNRWESWPHRFPHRYLSILSPDVFQASAAALDVLLSLGNTTQRKSGRPPSYPKSVAYGVEQRQLEPPVPWKAIFEECKRRCVTCPEWRNERLPSESDYQANLNAYEAAVRRVLPS